MSHATAGRAVHQIKVWDNFVGIASVGGAPDKLDSHCVSTFGSEQCHSFAVQQNVRGGTFVDVLAAGGYNVTMYGKVHAGAGLDRYPGKINAWPFSGIGSSKAAGEWARATGILPVQTVPKLQVYPRTVTRHSSPVTQTRPRGPR